MTLATDAADILSIWGATHSVQRKTVTYSNTGKATSAWAEQITPTLYIQPVSGDIERLEAGENIKSSHVAFGENGIDVLEGDRIQKPGWSAGEDEYEVRMVEEWAPSHVRIRLTQVKGHGG